MVTNSSKRHAPRCRLRPLYRHCSGAATSVALLEPRISACPRATGHSWRSGWPGTPGYVQQVPGAAPPTMRVKQAVAHHCVCTQRFRLFGRWHGAFELPVSHVDTYGHTARDGREVDPELQKPTRVRLFGLQGRVQAGCHQPTSPLPLSQTVQQRANCPRRAAQTTTRNGPSPLLVPVRAREDQEV
jgi:hypothetical protein